MADSDYAELAQFLLPDQRIDLKMIALQHVLGLTATKEGISALSEVPVIPANLLKLLNDSQDAISKDAAKALINISSDPSAAKSLLQCNQLTDLVKTLYDKMSDETSSVADAAAMILSNLTRDIVSCREVWHQLQENSVEMERLVFIMCQEGYNKKGATLSYLAPVLSNLSQLPEVRSKILDEKLCIIQRLLPFTEYAGSHVKKGGVIGALRNCCFHHESHEWLLSPEVDILPRLLLPLAAQTPEHLTDEEIDGLPVDLQYLDEDKKIEEDPDLRKMLLEALVQLCAKRSSREILRKNNAYIILRELHKVETNREVLLAVENVVDILIKTEDEINLDNYKDVEVPAELVPKLLAMDELYLKD